MYWHEKFQNNPVGLLVGDHQYPLGSWITNNYRRTCWNKNCQEEPIGIGGRPPITTSINPHALGRNGIHSIEFPHEVRKIILNLALNEPLSLV
jgi:hypothetical protein